MTTEERAEDCIPGERLVPLEREYREAIADAIRKAIAEEREACAKLADANKLSGLSDDDHWNIASAYLAEAIRTGQSAYWK